MSLTTALRAQAEKRSGNVANTLKSAASAIERGRKAQAELRELGAPVASVTRVAIGTGAGYAAGLLDTASPGGVTVRGVDVPKSVFAGLVVGAVAAAGGMDSGAQQIFEAASVGMMAPFAYQMGGAMAAARL